MQIIENEEEKEREKDKEKDKEIEQLKATIQSLKKELYDTKGSQMPASQMQTSSTFVQPSTSAEPQRRE